MYSHGGSGSCISPPRNGKVGTDGFTKSTGKTAEQHNAKKADPGKGTRGTRNSGKLCIYICVPRERVVHLSAYMHASRAKKVKTRTSKYNNIMRAVLRRGFALYEVMQFGSGTILKRYNLEVVQF